MTPTQRKQILEHRFNIVKIISEAGKNEESGAISASIDFMGLWMRIVYRQRVFDLSAILTALTNYLTTMDDRGMIDRPYAYDHSIWAYDCAKRLFWEYMIEFVKSIK